MDSITHIALGAAIGQIWLGNKIGKKALLIGAGANSFPDIDFAASLWLAPADNVLAHRGFTHSILFMILMTWVFYWGATQWDKQQRISRRSWFLFFLAQLALHLFVDAFNAYGVGWFIPFDDARISLHTLFVVDPFYSTWLIISLLLLTFLPTENRHRNRIAMMGILISSLYLAYAIGNKIFIQNEVRKNLISQNINYQRFFTTPTPLNTLLWFAVAEVDSGYYIGFRSVFDQANSTPVTYIPRNEHLLVDWQEDHALKQLKKFSQGYYTVEYQSDTLIFNDLRFGQITGWDNPNERFVFHYYLNFPKENLLVMQRGRFAKWNKNTVQSMIARIKGI
jgi:inner membrane protein